MDINLKADYGYLNFKVYITHWHILIAIIAKVF